MFLKRVQVPDFRVLKDVDISFEPEFSPSIFPLGSLNGGGKSTLLQLLFVLLGCSGDPDRHVFIQNMLEGFDVDPDEQERSLATIEIIDNDILINLDFVCINYQKYLDGTGLNNSANVFHEKTILNREYYSLSESIERTKSYHHDLLTDNVPKAIEVEKNIFILNKKIDQLRDELEKIDLVKLDISKSLKNQGIHFVSNYFSLNDKENLICFKLRVGDQPNLIRDYLQKTSKNVYLAAPFTQVFQFLPKNETKRLFKEKKQKSKYYSELEKSKEKLHNFFTYDFLSVDQIISFFKSARDKDFKQKINTGKYGNNFDIVLRELNSLLENKKININPDLSGVNFRIDNGGEERELFPENFSHGELKRLSIYVWLKHLEIKDAIVLMDEIENAFHPDWQSRIVSDLAEWGASNQYILATHSYELCEALTPSHVKELEPKLIADQPATE